jgi:hypothetical protein
MKVDALSQAGYPRARSQLLESAPSWALESENPKLRAVAQTHSLTIHLKGIGIMAVNLSVPIRSKHSEIANSARALPGCLMDCLRFRDFGNSEPIFAIGSV